ncbi:MAG: ferric reductase-like transmembrane domain-containing protein [Eubacterium sp.]|nr:ferric reductase-like transmembrane domain-containing protein [Eubacterium sp.]
MNLIIGLIAITIFYILTADAIKKVPVAFYVGIYFWTGFVIVYYSVRLYATMPQWFTSYFMDIFQRGIFSTVTFMIVMFLGTVRKHNKITKKLMKVRGEISIIGCLSALCHNVIFGMIYFTMLFKNPELMSTRSLIASILTIVLLALMLPLLITSFRSVRRKMKAKTWKNVQRLAYPFFILIYVHIMVLFTADISKNIVSIAAYTAIYALYVILRLRKYFLKKNAPQNIANEKTPAIVK